MLASHQQCTMVFARYSISVIILLIGTSVMIVNIICVCCQPSILGRTSQAIQDEAGYQTDSVSDEILPVNQMRVSSWDAQCQPLGNGNDDDKELACKLRSDCPTDKISKPFRTCRVPIRSVFGRTLKDSSGILSRRGLEGLGICCRNDRINQYGQIEDVLRINTSWLAMNSILASKENIGYQQEMETNDLFDGGMLEENRLSAVTKDRPGETFDIMPYSQLMRRMGMTSKIVQPLQKQKNFTAVNVGDLGIDCGRRNLTYKMMRLGRIVGGETAGFSDWPWVVMVLNYGRPRCGGTLLSNQAVVTAAHCVSGNLLLYNLTVRIGMFNTNERDSLPFPPLLLRVARIIRHPDFDLTTLLNDVAILQLSIPIKFAPNILPACIASQEYPPNTPTVILGWGKEEENNTVYELPDSLQAVSVPIYNRRDCGTYFSKQGLTNLIGVRHVCAGGTDLGGKDACQGDSGGPMLLQNPDGRFELLGVISWGFGCGVPHIPGVYTNIYFYKSWLVDTINKL